jgi:hypothetical protein
VKCNYQGSAIDYMAKEQYQKAANKKDLKEGCLLKIEPYCKSIVLAMVNGNVCDGFVILT